VFLVSTTQKFTAATDEIRMHADYLSAATASESKIFLSDLFKRD
jgi:hypothetical protein